MKLMVTMMLDENDTKREYCLDIGNGESVTLSESCNFHIADIPATSDAQTDTTTNGVQ